LSHRPRIKLWEYVYVPWGFIIAVIYPHGLHVYSPPFGLSFNQLFWNIGIGADVQKGLLLEARSL